MGGQLAEGKGLDCEGWKEGGRASWVFKVLHEEWKGKPSFC